MTGQLSPAVVAAQEAQTRLEECLGQARSFRLEAGAGAGKTYSLVAALKTIITEKGTELMHAGQQVACITYTEVARLEIANEIEEHPAILVNTIHGFGWSFISRFQKTLRELVAATESYAEAVEAAGGVHGQVVEYNLGYFSIDEKKITLHHDDVPRFLGAMISNLKFKRIFKSLYPVLFVDEYQDTDPAVMEALSEHFFALGDGPVVGLFGDHWQTIFRKDHRLLELPNVEGIDKGSNFRSVPAIVDVLNRLRPELFQHVNNVNGQGEARFYHTNEFAGDRVDSRNGKKELPDAEHAAAVGRVRSILQADGWDFDPQKTKILMLTHNAIAAERGYPNLARIFDRNEAFAKKEDAAIAFLVDTVEPICIAYAAGRFGEMFRLMGSLPRVRSTNDKAQWQSDMSRLLEIRESRTIGELLDHLKLTQRPRLSDRVLSRETELANLGAEASEDEPKSIRRHRELRNVPYSELIALTEFVNGYTPFATQHSVKGAEFENVLVLLSGGWNHYNWPQFLELLETENITDKNSGAFHRCRNLFYVAISRPKKRLAVLATQALSDTAIESARRLFGEQNVHALPMD
jgi:DNA helicase-2/ATP-dependent DNA helicase PcrA